MDGYDEGIYLLGDQDISTLSTKELARIRLTRFGFIFQSFHLINHLTAVENVELPLGYSGISASIRRSKAVEMLDRVGLGEKLKNRPGELSGGEQQRVARALVNCPELILADEPTGNLDSVTSQRIIELLRSLNDDGITIMLVTHDKEIINDAVKVITMSDGKINGTCK